MHCTCSTLYNGFILNFISILRSTLIHPSRKPSLLKNHTLRAVLKNIYKVRFIALHWDSMDLQYTLSELQCLERLQLNNFENPFHSEVVDSRRHCTNLGQVKYLNNYLMDIFRKYPAWVDFLLKFCGNSFPRSGDFSVFIQQTAFHHARKKFYMSYHTLNKIALIQVYKFLMIDINPELRYYREDSIRFRPFFTLMKI